MIELPNPFFCLVKETKPSSFVPTKEPKTPMPTPDRLGSVTALVAPCSPGSGVSGATREMRDEMTGIMCEDLSILSN